LNVTEYTYLLNHPNAVNEKQAKALELVIESFPFFQSARALYLKGLYNQDSYKYNFVLKQTAAHTIDRSVLFDFITSDEFTIIDKNVYERKLNELMLLDVHSSEVLTQEIETLSSSTDIGTKDDLIQSEDEVLKEYTEEETTTVVSDKENLLEQPFFSLTENEEIVDIEDIEESGAIVIENTLELPTISEKTDIIESVESQIETEENLQIGKPLNFQKEEKHSFEEWLQLTRVQPINRIFQEKNQNITPEKPVKTEEKKRNKLELIDKFIELNPKIPPVKEVIEPSKPIEIPDTSHLMTETLARVYLEQKKYQKAIQAYEILILKYPEKSVFFADRIRDIKKLQQNNL